MRRARLTCSPMETPREVQEIGAAAYRSALAEVGIVVEHEWSDERNCHINVGVRVGEPHHSRASTIAALATGLPYEWIDE